MREGGTGESYTVKFIRHLHDKVTPAMTDELDLWIPEDSVEVEYCRDQGRNIWDPISQGSAGQKTAAVLAFILSHGSNPIILDQPEDDLDNHLINDLVVEQIREKKPKRQIIVVTHNPNIVVNGDAELVHVMDFSDGQIGAKRSGCLQEKEIRREICQVMEGERAKAFEQRYRRIYIQGEHVRHRRAVGREIQLGEESTDPARVRQFREIVLRFLAAILPTKSPPSPIL